MDSIQPTNPLPAIPRARHVVIAGVLIAFATGGLSNAWAQKTAPGEALKSATETAKKIRERTGAKPAATPLPPGSACDILSPAAVQKSFPGAKAGERSTRLEEYGITECAWKDAKGQVVLVTQEYFSKGDVKEEAMGMAQGFADPLKPEPLKNIRFETFRDLGYPAMGFVEKADAKRGILGDGAMLFIGNGERTISMGSSELAHRDRTAALKTLDELGKVATARLKK